MINMKSTLKGFIKKWYKGNAFNMPMKDYSIL